MLPLPSRPATTASLDQWLDYQLRVHPREVELGLERVAAVWQRLGAPPAAPIVVTVAGTNGKGSTIAFLESMLAADGKRVGAFTSPHLLRYNERVRVCGRDSDDAALVDAFTRIDTARGDTPLTYFEFGTLAALWIFSNSRLDVALLEVGLGGRLDAVNIVDADVAIVTTIDLDHQDWLGNDREAIGREKAGVFRRGRVAIAGEKSPPHSLIAHALDIGAQLWIAGRDFIGEPTDQGWRWTSIAPSGLDGSPEPIDLPFPSLEAPCQIDNAAAAIASIHALRGRIGWNPAAIADGVRNAHAAARLQRFGSSPQLIVDVAHNPQAAAMLSTWLQRHPCDGRTLAVFGALGDKDVGGVVEAVAPFVDAWFLAGLDRDSPRGLTAIDLRARLADDAILVEPALSPDVAGALDAAWLRAKPSDRVIAFGSFFVAAAALVFAQQRGLADA
jgi:dihydrofolate synthase/folylpolyglutamate synthase